MSISSRRSAAGCFVRWIRIPPLPGADVRNITTLKIQERQYEEISTFQSFRVPPFHLPPPRVSSESDGYLRITLLSYLHAPAVMALLVSAAVSQI